jgi:cobalt/nickel transport system permease protein
VHIADGVLSGPVLAATGVVAAAAVVKGLRDMDYDRAPLVGVMASVFFVSSLIRVPVGVGSAHLILNGLMGLMLGWAVFPALAAALLLQAVLFGHGGLVSLGANTLIAGFPAIICYYGFRRAVRPDASSRRVFALAFALGATSIVLSCVAVVAALYLSDETYIGAAAALCAAHVPVAVADGLVTGWAVTFLHKVRPETLGLALSSPSEPSHE